MSKINYEALAKECKKIQKIKMKKMTDETLVQKCIKLEEEKLDPILSIKLLQYLVNSEQVYDVIFFRGYDYGELIADAVVKNVIKCSQKHLKEIAEFTVLVWKFKKIDNVIEKYAFVKAIENKKFADIIMQNQTELELIKTNKIMKEKKPMLN